MEKLGSDYSDVKKEVVSEFNEAKYQIFRLHLLWLSCNNLSNAGKLEQWKWKLDTIWRELSPDAYKKEEDYKELEKFSTKVKEYNLKITKAGTNKALLYSSLEDKEIFLRILQDKVGKGTKTRNIDDEDFDE